MWYSLEILYDGAEPGSVEIHRVKNLYNDQMKVFRETIFATGLFIHSETNPLTEGEIIPPQRLRKIFVYMQQKKFE
jgi:hypothetical protein